MATIKKGILTAFPWRDRHLRDMKRFFWKRERKYARCDVLKRLFE